MSDEAPRFKDGRSGISIDRVLIRWVNITQILLAFVALFGMVFGGMWAVLKLLNKLDELETAVKQVPILQQQISTLQGLVVNVNRYPRRDESQ